MSETTKHQLSNGWIMTTQLIEIHRVGEIEKAIEYMILDPDKKEMTSVSEMYKVIPDETDDEREDILKTITRKHTPDGRLKLNKYMSGTIAGELVKKGSIYNTKNAWERGY